MKFFKIIINVVFVILFTCNQIRIVGSISLVSGPRDAQVFIGTEVMFNCEAVNTTLHLVHWLKYTDDGTVHISSDEHIVIDSERFNIVSGSFGLHISNVQIADCGRYECIYSDKRSQKYSKFTPNHALATLTVSQIPAVICSLTRDSIPVTSETPFYVGEFTRYVCSAKGHGNTSVILNITESDVDIVEYVIKDVFNQTDAQSDELVIENIDTEFKCFIQSESSYQLGFCGVKVNVFLPEVEIQPKPVSVFESTDISFKCSGINLKTNDLNYEWEISPTVPGEVDGLTNSVMSITNIMRRAMTPSVVVTCFVREGNMVWNSSTTFSILSTNQVISPTTSSPETPITIIVIMIAVTAVIVVLGAVLYRHRKQRDENINDTRKSCDKLIEFKTHNDPEPIYEKIPEKLQHSRNSNIYLEPIAMTSNSNIYLEPISMTSKTTANCSETTDTINPQSYCNNYNQSDDVDVDHIYVKSIIFTPK